MNRIDFENYLSDKVRIKLFNGSVYEGYLRKTGDEIFKDNPNLYIPKNYYVLIDDDKNSTSCVFRCSHVVSIREL